MRSRLVATLLCAGLVASPACAHRQYTNKEVAVAGMFAVGIAAVIYLVVAQCHKGGNFCGDAPAN